MNVRIAILAALCCTVLAAFAVRPAAADEPATLIEGSVSSIGLSPGNVYGPWQFETLCARGITGLNDKPGFTIVTRQDGDSGVPTGGTTAIVDDYHQFSPNLSSYAQVEFSGGSVFPTSGAYLEMDPTVFKNFVFAAGYGVLETPNGLSQSYLNAGPQWYFPHGSVTVRFIPLWTQGQVTASSVEGALTLGDEGRTLTTLTVQNGVVPAYDVTNPLLASQFQDRVFSAEIAFKHWIHPRFGYEIDLDEAHAADRFTGANVYDAFGATVGIFIGVGHSPTMP